MLLEFISNYFSPFAFFLAILIAYFLFNSKKGMQLQNLMLGAFFLSIGIMIGSRFIWAQVNFEKYSLVLGIGTNFRFLIAPFFYLYLQSVFIPSFKLKSIHLLHSLIFVALTLNHILFKVEFIYNWRAYIIIDVVQFLVYIIWAFMSFNLLSLFVNKSKLNFKKSQIQWLRFFIVANVILMLYLCYSLIFETRIFGDPAICFWYGRLIGFTNFVFISAFVYFLLRFPEMLVMPFKNKSVSDELYNAISKKLVSVMEKDQVWRHDDISLQKLAEFIKVSPKQLSYTINQLHGNNFYSYINQYRIEECKRKFTDKGNDSRSILEIAFATGFNSKNSFNVAFKRATGKTPSAFRKDAKKTS